MDIQINNNASIQGDTNLPNDNIGTKSTSKKKYSKLPPIQINRFSGNIRDWLNFWTSFEYNIHSNEDLNNVEKFYYLKNHLEGDALESLNGLLACDASYEDAVKWLNSLRD